MIPKFKVMIARFPSRGECAAEVDWVVDTTLQCFQDPRVESVKHWAVADTPVTMTRNRAIKDAVKNGIDILLMVDDDMGPDLINPKISFWETSFDFIVNRWNQAPTVIGAPYCGAPPHENVFVFKWNNTETDSANANYRLSQYTRSEAEDATGIKPAAALPTGVIAIDMRVITGFEHNGKKIKLPHPSVSGRPYFYYEWEDAEQTQKASTEDVTFTRDVSLLYNAHQLDAVFCNWDTWAVHFKTKAVSKPYGVKPHDLAKIFKDNS